jgi:hypothetical protein
VTPPDAGVTPTPPAQIPISPLPPGPAHQGGVARALRTARDYGLLLALAAAVIFFLGIQGRVDRRDPRIARAPIDDQLDFRDFR